MHEFPPQPGLSFDGFSWVLLIVAAIAMFFAFRPTGSERSCFVWGMTLAVSAIVTLSYFSRFVDPLNIPSRWNVVLAAIITATAMVAIYRNVFQHREKKFDRAVRLTGAGLGFVLVLVLGALIVPPSGSGHRIAAGRTQCKYNLKQIGLALHNYHDVYSQFPMSVSTIDGQQSSWRVRLLPFLDHAELCEQYSFSAAWDTDVNLPMAQTRVEEYLCPHRRSLTDHQQRFLTAYVVPDGDGSIFHGPATTRIPDISDGTSNTLMVLEACGTNIVWTEPHDARLSEQDIAVNGPGNKPDTSNSILSSYHLNGAQALLADGSARFISADTSPEILKALLTKAANDDTGDVW